jgi:hypothetical protein
MEQVVTTRSNICIKTFCFIYWPKNSTNINKTNNYISPQTTENMMALGIQFLNRGIRENRTVGDVASFWSGLKSGVHAFEVALKVEASFQNWQVQKKKKKKV